MGKITSITEQKKNKKRVNIFIDGEYNCSLEKMAAFSFGLKEGVSIDEDRLNLIMRDSEEKSAFDLAVKYLCVRMRTRVEVERYLLGKGYLDSTVNNTIIKLIEYKYINDEAFAKAYINTYRCKYGNNRLAFELSKLGVAEEIYQNLLAIDDAGEEVEACEKIAEKYIKTHQKQLNYQKLANHLYARGFNIELVRATAKKLIKTEENDLGY